MRSAEPGVARPRRARGPILLVVFAVLLCAAALASITLGRYSVPFADLIRVTRDLFAGQLDDSPASMVVWQIRAPRILAAVLIGLALSVAGAVYQGMFRNPLVSPDILGASAGAGFGASLAIMWRLGLEGIQVFAFVFGLAAVLLAWSVSRTMRRDPLLGLVLAGIVVGAIFTAGTSFLKYVADPESDLPAITFWLMGGLNGVRMDQLPYLAIPVFGCLAVLWVCRWRLNVLTFGDETARTLGINVQMLRAVVIVCATLLTTASVAIGGLIAWVGLVVPHLVRLTVGPDLRIVVPAAVLAGGFFLLVVDNIARNLLTMELPLGVLTSVVGAPFMLALIALDRRW